MPKYNLLSARQAHNLKPDKYRVPDKNAVKMVSPGNIVQVMVDYVNTGTGRPQAEAIWCVVLRRDRAQRNTDDKLVVAAWDMPPPRKTLYHGINAKTVLDIKPHNIIDIMFEQPKKEVKLV